MRNLRIVTSVIALLIALPALGFAQASAGMSSLNSATPTHSSTEARTQPSTVNPKVTVHATKGVVKFVDATKLVIKRTPQDGREMTFALNSSTERSGDVKVGSTVDIRYRADADQQIATAVTVVHAKQQPSAPRSHH